MNSSDLAKAAQRETTPFDYIIVGSGAGGGPLAARLALGGKRVLLLEAGSDPTSLSARDFPDATPGEVHDVPGYHAAATEDKEMSWQFSVRHYLDDARQQQDEKYNKLDASVSGTPYPPDPRFLDSRNHPRGKRGIFYPRSAALGGCTAHHAMIVVAPNDKDWDYIANISGDDSWRPSQMRGYFTKLENCLYLGTYANALRKFLGIFYYIWRAIAFLLSPRSVLDDGGHGRDGWQPTSFIDPDLVNRIAQEDRRFFRVLAQSALSVLHRDRKLIGLLKQVLFRFRLLAQIDPNDQNTRQLSPEGVFLIPTGIAGQVIRFAGKVMTGRRWGVREFLCETQRSCPDNLVIATGYHVTRVIFDSDGSLQAIGVEAAHGEHLYEASPLQQAAPFERVQFFTRGEVVLCGGAFNSPQLLMLSGIGPAEHLTQHGIEGLTGPDGKKVADIVDLPGVGRNLQDRYEVSVISELDAELPTLDKVTFTPGDPLDTARGQWFKDHSGLYATNGGTLAIMKRSAALSSKETEPDLFIFGAPAAFRGYYWGWSRELLRPTAGSTNDERKLWSWVILKAYTQNQNGFVRLCSGNPFDQPEICFDSFNELATARGIGIQQEISSYTTAGKAPPEYLLDQKIANDCVLENSRGDLIGLSDAVKTVRAINACNRKQFVREVQPGTDRPDDSAALNEWIQTQAWGHHASCTCRIGSDPWTKDTSKLSDKFAVLDSGFRVHGVRSLRVVDASVFPKIPGYFILAPTLMISEKAADTILEDAQEYPRALREAEMAAVYRRRQVAHGPLTGPGGVAGPAGASAAAGATASSSILPPMAKPPVERHDRSSSSLRTYLLKEASQSKGAGAPDQPSSTAMDSAPQVPSNTPEEGSEPCHPPTATVGLALSGGGIRSATFCLGILQALAERNRLRDVDFLSTVSGSAFIGSFLGRLFTRRVATQSTDPVGRVQEILRDDTSAPISWLRTQANYILGAGTVDVRQNLAVYFRNVFTIHLVIGVLIFASFGLLRGLSDFLPITQLGSRRISGLEISISPWWWLPLAVAVFGVLPGALGYWLAPKPRWHYPHPIFSLLAWAVLTSACILVANFPGGLLYATIGALILFGSWLWQEAARWGYNPQTGQQGVVVRNRLTRALGEVLAIFGLTLAWALIDTFARSAAAKEGLAGKLGALLVAMAPVLPLLRNLVQIIRNRVFRQGGSPAWMYLVALIAITLAFFLLVIIDVWVHKLFIYSPSWGWCAVGIAFAFSLAVGQALSFLNESSLHGSYAARLTRTFQGASNEARVYSSEANPARDVQLSHPDDDLPFHCYHPEQKGGPLHLIGVCVNETVDTASQREIREHKGLPMCLGPVGVSVGRRFHALWAQAKPRTPSEKMRSKAMADEWPPPRTALEPILAPNNPRGFHVFGSRHSGSAPVERLSLGAWTGISGAAFSTGEGRKTTRGMALLLGLVNLRLGYWWNSGIAAGDRPGRYPESLWRRLKHLPTWIFRSQGLLISEWRALFPGPSSRYWYLSDGGHFDNTAIYELLRRQVEFIICCDAESDPNYCWGDLAELGRQAYLDFGAKITWMAPSTAGAAGAPAWIQQWINPLALANFQSIIKNGSSRIALAQVCYDDDPAPKSWILLLKPCTSSADSFEILNYKAENPDFPQQSTLQQFFNDQQWESYRTLGKEMGFQVFK